MNQPKTPQFTPGMQHKAGILKRLCDSENQTIEKIGFPGDLVKPPVPTMADHLHIRSC
jgi:hypothetical protein